MKEIITSGGADVDVVRVRVRVPVSVGKHIFIRENYSVIGSIIISTPILLGGVSVLIVVIHFIVSSKRLTSQQEVGCLGGRKACFPGWPVCENDGGGDVQRTTPGTSGSVGERRDGRRVVAVNDDGGSGGGGRGGGIILILWLAALWGGGPNDKNLSLRYVLE
jgi:hypothetical protein